MRINAIPYPPFSQALNCPPASAPRVQTPPPSSIKSTYSPGNTCVSSYEINSACGYNSGIEQIDYTCYIKGQRAVKTTLNNNVTGSSETPRVVTFASAKRMTGITVHLPGFLEESCGL